MDVDVVCSNRLCGMNVNIVDLLRLLHCIFFNDSIKFEFEIIKSYSNSKIELFILYKQCETKSEFVTINLRLAPFSSTIHSICF